MSLTRADRRGACRERRARQSALPAPVVGPTVIGLVVVIAAAVAGHLAGFGARGVAAVVVASLVVVGIVGRRTVSSLAVGAGIRLVQPYRTGERVRIHLPSCGRVVEAEIVRVGAANTTVVVRNTHDGLDSLVAVPNNRILRGIPETSRRA